MDEQGRQRQPRMGYVDADLIKSCFESQYTGQQLHELARTTINYWWARLGRQRTGSARLRFICKKCQREREACACGNINHSAWKIPARDLFSCEDEIRNMPSRRGIKTRARTLELIEWIAEPSDAV